MRWEQRSCVKFQPFLRHTVLDTDQKVDDRRLSAKARFRLAALTAKPMEPSKETKRPFAKPSTGDRIFPDDRRLWDEFLKLLRPQVPEYGELAREALLRSTIIFQIDTRPAGVLDDNVEKADADLNQSALLMHNFNKAQGREHGLYFFFRVNSGLLGSYSVFWLKAIILKFLRVIFRTAALIYVDSDAVVFLEVLYQYLATLERIDSDQLLAATDVNSPLNAGFMCILPANPSFSPKDFDKTKWRTKLDEYEKVHMRTLLDGVPKNW